MSEHTMRERAARLLKRRGSLSSSTQSAETRGRGDGGREARRLDSMSIVSHTEEPGCHDDSTRYSIYLENTYHMAPPRVFPALSTRLIAQEVLSSYLMNETYNPEICRGISKTVSEAIKSRVKELEVSRFKLAVLVHIGGSGGGHSTNSVKMGERAGDVIGGGGTVSGGTASGGPVSDGAVSSDSGGGVRGGGAVKGVEEGAVRVVSRCLWDTSTDTVVSVSFTRRGLYAVANIYAIYYE